MQGGHHGHLCSKRLMCRMAKHCDSRVACFARCPITHSLASGARRVVVNKTPMIAGFEPTTNSYRVSLVASTVRPEALSRSGLERGNMTNKSHDSSYSHAKQRGLRGWGVTFSCRTPKEGVVRPARSMHFHIVYADTTIRDKSSHVVARFIAMHESEEA